MLAWFSGVNSQIMFDQAMMIIYMYSAESVGKTLMPSVVEYVLQYSFWNFCSFGKMVACFRYASIDVHSVYLPPSKLDFYYENQEWIQQEVNEVRRMWLWIFSSCGLISSCTDLMVQYKQVIGRAELLFSDVLNAIRVLVEKRSGRQLNRRQIADLERMLQKEKEEFEVWISQLDL